MVTQLDNPRAMVLLAAADAVGPAFMSSGRATLLVQFASGSAVGIEALRPANPASFPLYVGWSADAAFTAAEINGASVMMRNGSTEIVAPEGAGAADQHLGFGVPSTKTIRAVSGGGLDLSDFTGQAATVTVDGRTIQIWATTDAVARADHAGESYVVTVNDDDVWLDVTRSLVGAANIGAHGQYEVDFAPGVTYRLNPAAAGSRAWLIWK